MEQAASSRRPRVAGRGSVTFDAETLRKDGVPIISSTTNSPTKPGPTLTTTLDLPLKPVSPGPQTTSSNSIPAVVSPPRNARLSRAARSLAMEQKTGVGGGGGAQQQQQQQDEEEEEERGKYGSASSSSSGNNTMRGRGRAEALGDLQGFNGINASGNNINNSSILLAEFPKLRATSGSEVGLELDPHQAKVIEVYGFVGWIVTILAWICYLLWAYLPETILHDIGVAYYPNKYWALAAPALLVTAVCSYGYFYGLVGLMVNPHLDSFETLMDGYSKPYRLPPPLPASSSATAAVGDILPPVGISNFFPTAAPVSALLSMSATTDIGNIDNTSTSSVGKNDKCCPDCGSQLPRTAATTNKQHHHQQQQQQQSTPLISSSSSSSGATYTPLRGAGARSPGMSLAGAAGVLLVAGGGGSTITTTTTPSTPGSSPGTNKTSSSTTSSPSFRQSGTNNTNTNSGGVTNLSGAAPRSGSFSSANATGAPLSSSFPGIPRSPFLPPALELSIDKYMTTPDIADVPVTLLNRLQFGRHR